MRSGKFDSPDKKSFYGYGTSYSSSSSTKTSYSRREKVKTYGKKRSNLYCPNCGAEYYHEFLDAVKSYGKGRITWHSSSGTSYGTCKFCGNELKPK
jgi:hypothetical protein